MECERNKFAGYETPLLKTLNSGYLSVMREKNIYQRFAKIYRSSDFIVNFIFYLVIRNATFSEFNTEIFKAFALLRSSSRLNMHTNRNRRKVGLNCECNPLRRDRAANVFVIRHRKREKTMFKGDKPGFYYFLKWLICLRLVSDQPIYMQTCFSRSNSDSSPHYFACSVNKLTVNVSCEHCLIFTTLVTADYTMARIFRYDFYFSSVILNWNSTFRKIPIK